MYDFQVAQGVNPDAVSVSLKAQVRYVLNVDLAMNGPVSVCGTFECAFSTFFVSPEMIM